MSNIDEHIDIWGEYFSLAKRPRISHDDRHDYCILAMQRYHTAMNLPGTREEQLRKIGIMPLLIELVIQLWSATPEIVGWYFYTAVKIARIYLWDEFLDTPWWSEILTVFLKYIDPTFRKKFRDRQVSSFAPLLGLVILAESNKRLSQDYERIEEIQYKHWETENEGDIIAALEGYLGPVRLHISSEKGGEDIVLHNLSNTNTQNNMSQSRVIRVPIFDKNKEYRYSIDRWSDQSSNQFTENEYKKIIEPLLSIYIQKREYAFFIWTIDNMTHIEEYESQDTILWTPRQYHWFITQVLVTHWIQSSDWVNYMIAIDICRQLTLSPGTTRENIEYIDRQLRGVIDREVFQLVQILLLSRHENMNGSWYPYGICKKDIPLIVRIYVIIRSYEALSGNLKNQALSRMEDWRQWWYFDSEVFQVFLETISEQDEEKKETKSIAPITPSAHRDGIYRKYLEQWTSTQSIISELCDCYIDTRLSVWDQSKLNILFLKISKLTLTLRQISRIRKIIRITRHGETMSDCGIDIPGSDDEILTQQGIHDSQVKWEAVQGLRMLIYTSPLARAIQTASIIAGAITRCEDILVEDILKNPKKNLDNGRYTSYSQKLLADNTSAIMDFLIELISSPEESSILMVAHRDSARHIIFWLTNLFTQDGVHGTKTPIDNTTTYTFLFRWDHVVTGDELIQGGLIFSVENWKTVWDQLRSISQEIFGIDFGYKHDLPVDIIKLHDRFLDYIDKMIVRCPQKVTEFLDALDTCNATKHIRKIIEWEYST